MQYLWGIGVICLTLYVLLIPKGECTNELTLPVLGTKSLLSYIPFYNSYVITKNITGDGKAVGILSAICAGVFGVCIIERILNTSSVLISIISTGLIILSLLITYFVEMYTVTKIAYLINDTRLKKWCILPPLAYYKSVKLIKIYFKRNKDIINGTFDGE